MPPKRTYKQLDGSEDQSGESPVPACKLEQFKAKLAAAYPQAVPRQLAHGLLAGVARYPEERLKLALPMPLHVEANEQTVSWIMAVVCELAAEPEE